MPKPVVHARAHTHEGVCIVNPAGTSARECACMRTCAAGHARARDHPHAQVLGGETCIKVEDHDVLMQRVVTEEAFLNRPP